MNSLWMPGCPETSAMDVVLTSKCRPTYSRHRQQKQLHVRSPTVRVPCHFAVLSKRADFVCRASGGKRRSEGMASPLVLIMGLSRSTVLLDGSGSRGSTGARFVAARAVLGGFSRQLWTALMHWHTGSWSGRSPPAPSLRGMRTSVPALPTTTVTWTSACHDL